MKDAKGHGSEKRGGSFQDVARGHQLNIARRTVKMPAGIAGVMGGMSQSEAHAFIQQHGSAADKKMAAEYAQIPDHLAAAALAQGGAKSAPVPVHPGASGRSDFNVTSNHPVTRGPEGSFVVHTTPGAESPAAVSKTIQRVGNAFDASIKFGRQWGSPEAIKDFTDKYGGPRDHAAEQRGFNRGMREINRLKRQGK